MAEPRFTVALLRVVTAVGWADGELSAPERALIERWSVDFALDAQERAYLRFYLERPVERVQAEAFARALVEATGSRAEREGAVSHLQQLAEADGHIDPAEEQLLDRVRALFADTGDLGLLVNRLRAFFSSRPFLLSRAPDRELARLEEDLLRVWRSRGWPADPFWDALAAGDAPTPRQRALLFVGALAGCTWGELHKNLPDPKACLRTTLDVTEAEARFLAQFLIDPYAASLDRARLVRGVEDYAPRELALGLVELLFCLAALDGSVGDEETETIRGVSLGLKVTHRMFMERRLRYLEQRD